MNNKAGLSIIRLPGLFLENFEHRQDDSKSISKNIASIIKKAAEEAEIEIRKKMEDLKCKPSEN